MEITSAFQVEDDSVSYRTHRVMSSLSIEAASPHWPDLPCQPIVHVEFRYVGHSACWQVDAYLELADRARTQWSVCRNFRSRAEAAGEAVAFIMHARTLLARSLDGLPVETPGQRRTKAALRWADRQPYVGELRGKIAIWDRMAETAPNDEEREHAVTCRRLRENELINARDVLVRRFHRANHWYGFAVAYCQDCRGEMLTEDEMVELSKFAEADAAFDGGEFGGGGHAYDSICVCKDAVE